nr:uncharacterized protein LOC109167618 [Ipomoea batatas]
MKRMAAEGKVDGKKLKNTSPPIPPPLPRFLITTKAAVKPKTPSSVTNQEIAKFWRQKRMAEESHFLAAIKAAARIRAQNLSEDEYKAFEESLQEGGSDENAKIIIKPDKTEKEIRVGIKDWWTKSRYAYLNQPAIKSMDKRYSTYISQLNCYTTAPPRATTTFSVF